MASGKILTRQSGPGWAPGERVRIIGYFPEGNPIVVFRPKQYDLDKFYPDIGPTLDRT